MTKMLAAAFLAVVLSMGVAQAQPDLALTMAEYGNFAYPGCSQYSPQFTNYPMPPRGATSVPSGCRSTILMWVANVGDAATSAPVSLNLVFLPNQIRAGTILSIGGNGWTCGTTGTCNRSDALAAGSSYPPVTASVLVEDFAKPELNVFSMVSGGGDTRLTNNSVLDLNIIWPPIMGTTDLNQVPVPTGRVSQLVIHTVPEGLWLYVNGEFVRTPRIYTSPINFGNPPTTNQQMFTIGATDLNGRPIAANGSWEFQSISSGGTSPVPSFLARPNPMDFFVTGTWWEEVTVVFQRR